MSIAHLLGTVAASMLVGGVAPSHYLSLLFAGGETGVIIDPNYIGTMWQDAAKTIPVSSDGDPVRVITDYRGSGIEFVAPSDAHRPTYKTGTAEGWTHSTAYLQFSAGQILRYSGTALNTASISAYIRVESTVNGKWAFDFPHATTNAPPYARLSCLNSSNSFECRVNGTVYTTGGGSVFGTGKYPLCGSDPGNGRLFVNDIPANLFSAQSITYPNNQGVLIGGNPDNGELMTGKFFGFCVFNRASTTTDIDLLIYWNNPNVVPPDTSKFYISASKRYTVTKFSPPQAQVWSTKRYVVSKP